MGGELVMRAYTPTSSDDELGHFDLVIKARMRPMLQFRATTTDSGHEPSSIPDHAKS